MIRAGRSSSPVQWQRIPLLIPGRKGDRMQKTVIPGSLFAGMPYAQPSIKNGRQIVRTEGTANTTVVYAGGDQTVHGHALDTTLNGGIPVCAQRRYSV